MANDERGLDEAARQVPAERARRVEIAPAVEGDKLSMAALLREADLDSDFEPDVITELLVARDGAEVIGCAALEVRGPDALLRSLAVSPAWRGRGLGEQLANALLERARARGLRRAFLLTKTIPGLAERWGFRRVERGAIPEAVRHSAQFAGDGCASAVAMERAL